MKQWLPQCSCKTQQWRHNTSLQCTLLGPSPTTSLRLQLGIRELGPILATRTTKGQQSSTQQGHWVVRARPHQHEETYPTRSGPRPWGAPGLTGSRQWTRSVGAPTAINSAWAAAPGVGVSSGLLTCSTEVCRKTMSPFRQSDKFRVTLWPQDHRILTVSGTQWCLCPLSHEYAHPFPDLFWWSRRHPSWS